MARRSITIYERVEKQKEVVSKIKDRYENEVEKLEQLMNKQNEEDRKRLLRAFEQSDKTLEEVLEFLGYDESTDRPSAGKKTRRRRKIKINQETDDE